MTAATGRAERMVKTLLIHTLLTGDRFRCTCGAEVSGHLGFHEHVATAVLAALDGADGAHADSETGGGK